MLIKIVRNDKLINLTPRKKKRNLPDGQRSYMNIIIDESLFPKHGSEWNSVELSDWPTLILP